MLKRSKFGAMLLATRSARGWSQKTLGEIANVHHITIARLEAGDVQPREKTVRLLATALGVSTEKLAPRRTRRGAA